MTFQQEQDSLLAKAIADTSNSNSIVLVKNGILIGNGEGQQSRVIAARLAIMIAQNSKNDLDGAVAASDSFFPYPDAPEILIDAGIDAIFTTSGSIRDKETISLCGERGIPLYMMDDKIARGFYHR